MLISKYFADIKEPIASSFDMLSYKTYGYSQMSLFGNSADTYHHTSNGSLNRFTMFASFTVFRTLRVIRMTGSNEPPSPLPSLVVLTPTKQSTDHTIVQIHRLVLPSFTIVYLFFYREIHFDSDKLLHAAAGHLMGIVVYKYGEFDEGFQDFYNYNKQIKIKCLM